MKTRHAIQKKSDAKKARRAGRHRVKRKEGEDELDPFALAGKDYSPSMLGDVERRTLKRKKPVKKLVMKKYSKR